MRVREGGLDVPVDARPADEGVLGYTVVEERARRRGARVENRLQGLVVDLDQLGGILGERPALGDDERDRLAGVADLPAREHGMAGVGDDAVVNAPRGKRSGVEIAGGQHRDHARLCHRVGGVDHPEPRVRVGAADERDVEEVGELEVVEVDRLAAEEAPVLAAEYGPPDPA